MLMVILSTFPAGMKKKKKKEKVPFFVLLWKVDAVWVACIVLVLMFRLFIV